jgi:hypothetical protein
VRWSLCRAWFQSSGMDVNPKLSSAFTSNVKGFPWESTGLGVSMDGSGSHQLFSTLYNVYFSLLPTRK